MKSRFLVLHGLRSSAIRLSLVGCLWFSLFGHTLARAQTSSAGAIDEHTRLMQEYMARREEWVTLRRAALAKVKEAQSTAEKKQHLDKLAEDEKPLLAKMGEAGRAYKAAEKARRDQFDQSKPRG